MQLQRNNPLPLYEQLKNIIEQKIHHGELEPDQQIPSERELCDSYGVSRITVRQAIAQAVNEGLLYRTQGRGTFVSNHKIEQGLRKVNSFHQTLTKQGVIAATKLLKSETIPNTFYFSRLLNVNMAEQITNLQLIGYGDEDAIVFYDSFFSHDIGKKMIKAANRETEKGVPFSTLDLYGQDIGIVPTHVEQTFEATISNETISKLLQIEQHSPILLATSIVYSGEQPLEYKSAYYRGDKYKFFATREYDSSSFN